MRKPKKSRKRSISRRDFLKRAAEAAALPLVLAIPTKSRRIVTGEERLRPLREREAGFDEDLNRRLSQGVRPVPPGVKPPPPAPPPKTVINTAYDTSKQTEGTKATFSGKPERSDDTEYETHYDGSTTDYKDDPA